MQVDPIKPMLKPPGAKHLRLKYDELLSSFAFKFNLRRYNQYHANRQPQEALQTYQTIVKNKSFSQSGRG